MKFSEMPYRRPDLKEVKGQLAGLTERFKSAEDYGTAKAVFLEMDELQRHIQTEHNLAKIRYDIDTRDEFYETEMNFWNEAAPQLQEDHQAWTTALMESPFRPDFEKEYGELMF